MKIKFKKRLLAYLLDMIILSFIFSGIMTFIPENKNLVVLESELTELNEQYLKNEVNSSVYFNRYASITASLDKELVLNNLFSIVLILGYFVLLPYYWNGQTIGKKIMKIKINKEKESLGLNDLLLRTFIVNGVASSIISLCFIYILSDFSYFLLTLICSFIQILLVIISVFMIIYRHDGKGVQDLISGTQVVEG